MAQGVGSNSELPVRTPSPVRTLPQKYFLDEDWTDSFKLLFAETPARTLPWSGPAVKPFKAFDLEAIRKCAARLSTEYSEDECSDGYQIEPNLIRPFKAARKLKGHHFFICRSTARRARKHAAKIEEGGWYKSRPISHGSYGPYGFEPKP